jgi:hypothetical protein
MTKMNANLVGNPDMKNMFAAFPEYYSRLDILGIQISYNDKSIAFSWSGEITKDFTVNSHLLSFLKQTPEYPNSHLITVEPVYNATVMERIFLEPYSIDDWEMIELNAQFITENLLRQMRLIHSQQPILVHIKNSGFVKLRIKDLPFGCVLLTSQTEICV